MILCSCNALSVDQVKAAAQLGQPTSCPKEAYSRLGKRPQCGGCLCRAKRLLADEQPAASSIGYAMSATG